MRNYFRLYFCIDILISNTYCFDPHLFNLLIFSAIYISVFSYFLNRGLNAQTDRMAAWLCVVWRHRRRRKIRLQRSEKLLWLKHIYSLLSRLDMFHGLISLSFLYTKMHMRLGCQELLNVTLLVLGLECSTINKTIPWLLMRRLAASPGPQQSWYGLHKINVLFDEENCLYVYTQI